MKVLAFFPAAQVDIGEIWDYSADKWGADQADNYTDPFGQPAMHWPEVNGKAAPLSCQTCKNVFVVRM